MRLKNAFSLFNPTDSSFDMDKLKIANPSLWKKLKKQFDIGRQIIQIQLNNGLDTTNENTLRYYLMEFTGRFLQYGLKSLPASYNSLEPFFRFNIHHSIIQLNAEEESYAVSLIDFLDFVTDKDFSLDDINFFENISENVIYHFSFPSDFSEINFSNNGKEFAIGSLSLIRRGSEVSLLMQAGESYDEEEAKKYFEKITKQWINEAYSPVKKEIKLDLNDGNEPKVVNFENRQDLWKYNIGILLDLDQMTFDIRYVARDDNVSFKVLTDDFYTLSLSLKKISEEQFQEHYANQLKELSNFDAVFDFAKYCLALPYYIFENESKLIAVTYETNLNSIIKGPLSKKKFSSVPSIYKVFSKHLYYLESNTQAVIKSEELKDNSFNIEKSGYWKLLEMNEEGFDKKGKKIIGKTWVERNDVYFTSPKGITKIQRAEKFLTPNAGYIYIMRQAAFEENIFKVGLTRRDVEKRKKELSKTSSPDKFFVINSYLTKDCVEAEKEIHKKLEKYRLTSRREFFRCDLRIIMEICDEVIKRINL